MRQIRLRLLQGFLLLQDAEDGEDEAHDKEADGDKDPCDDTLLLLLLLQISLIDDGEGIEDLEDTEAGITRLRIGHTQREVVVGSVDVARLEEDHSELAQGDVLTCIALHIADSGQCVVVPGLLDTPHVVVGLGDGVVVARIEAPIARRSEGQELT